MAQIQPISIWKDGQEKQGEIFTLRIVMDDMESSCTFYYEIKEANYQDADGNEVQGQMLTNGNQSMGGDDYTSWDGSNAAAYTFVAGKLNIVLV